jgi:hypothetical protein
MDSGPEYKVIFVTLPLSPKLRAKTKTPERLLLSGV